MGAVVAALLDDPKPHVAVQIDATPCDAPCKRMVPLDRLFVAARGFWCSPELSVFLWAARLPLCCFKTPVVFLDVVCFPVCCGAAPADGSDPVVNQTLQGSADTRPAPVCPSRQAWGEDLARFRLISPRLDVGLPPIRPPRSLDRRYRPRSPLQLCDNGDPKRQRRSNLSDPTKGVRKRHPLMLQHAFGDLRRIFWPSMDTSSRTNTSTRRRPTHNSPLQKSRFAKNVPST